MDHRLIVAIGVFSMFVGVASVCLNPVTIIDNYYCNEKNISCLQCTEHTFYNGTCKTEYGDSHCPPCPFGTWNPKPHHLDRQCQEKPSNISKSVDDNGIHLPEDSKGQKTEKDPPSDNNEGLRPSVYLYFILLLLPFAMN